MGVVDVVEVCKYFQSRSDRVTALDGLSLEIRAGEVFGLLGPNGAGKTTLISILCGLTSFDSGSVRVFGLDVNLHRREIAEKINVVRGFSGAYPGLTVMNSMEYYMRLYDCYDERKARELVELVGLGGFEGHFTSELSSGLRQRFFFAKALASNPRLLLLDEPTVGLDVEAAVNIRSLIARQPEAGKSVLLTTHYLLEAEELCDRIALISKGKIVALGTAAELKELVKEREVVRVVCSNIALAVKEVKRVDGVVDVKRVHNGLEASIDGFETVSRVMHVLSGASFKVRSFEVVEPPLEEVFVKLAGSESK